MIVTAGRKADRLIQISGRQVTNVSKRAAIFAFRMLLTNIFGEKQ